MAVKDEVELLKAVKKAESKGVRMSVFYEPDFPKGYTAACSEPITEEKRNIFKRFRLWA